MTKVSLYIVPTPIGNLGDITHRAIEVLKEVEVILAEDTRTTGRLLKTYGIANTLKSFHQHNEHKQTDFVIEEMKAGRVFALVSDAGTPGISDPGFLLVREMLKHNLEVQTLPGPTAIIPALVNAGLPTDRFVFEGFLPHKKGRQTRLKILAEEQRTMVLYVSPHRLLKTLHQLMEHMGEDRQASLSRELSKKFEETIRGSLKEIATHFSNHPIKGEFVLVIAGKTH